MEKYAKNLLKTVFLPLLMVVVISATDCKASIYEESIAVCSCLIDLLHIWGKEEKSDQKCMKLSESIYYISDLYNFINEKKKFDDFLLKKGVKTIPSRP